MAALNRDSVLSTTSIGSVETPSMRQQDSVDDTDNRNTYRDRYTVIYESTEAQLKKQEEQVTKIRRKLSRLKTNFCILIVFLVNVIFTHILYCQYNACQR